MATATRSVEVNVAPTATNRPAVAAVCAVFLAWGCSACLHNLLKPHLLSIFDMSSSRAVLVQIASFATYFATSLGAARFVHRIGYPRSMLLALLIASAGALLFVPAAALSSFGLFLVALVWLAGGTSILILSANSYLALMGGSKTAASRISLAYAFMSLGIIIGPKIGAVLILSAAPVSAFELRSLSPDALHLYRVAQSASIRTPYTLIGTTLIAVAAIIASFKLPDLSTNDQGASAFTNHKVWRHSNLLYACLAMFACCASEAFVRTRAFQQVRRAAGGQLADHVISRPQSYYMTAMLVGCLLGALIYRFVKTQTLLAISASAAGVLVLLSISANGRTAMFSFAAVGLLSSILIPGLLTIGLREMGPSTGYASGMLTISMIAGTLVPELLANLAIGGVRYQLVLPALCYGFVLICTLKCFKTKHEGTVPMPEHALELIADR